MQKPVISYIVKTFGFQGAWGRGASLADAAANCRKAGGKKSDLAVISIVANDSAEEAHKAQIDSYGGICFGGENAPNAYLIPVGCTGTLGAILRATNA